MASRGEANWFQAKVLSLLLVPCCVLCPLSALSTITSSRELNWGEGGWESNGGHRCPSLSLRDWKAGIGRTYHMPGSGWSEQTITQKPPSLCLSHRDHRDTGTKARVMPCFSTPLWLPTVSYNPWTFQIPFFWMVTLPCTLFVCVCGPVAEPALLDFLVRSLIW